MDEFITLIQEELQVPPGKLAPGMDLSAISEMDSLGKLSIISMVDERYGVVLPPDMLSAGTTLSSLYEQIQAKVAA